MFWYLLPANRAVRSIQIDIVDITNADDLDHCQKHDLPRHACWSLKGDRREFEDEASGTPVIFALAIRSRWNVSMRVFYARGILTRSPLESFTRIPRNPTRRFDLSEMSRHHPDVGRYRNYAQRDGYDTIDVFFIWFVWWTENNGNNGVWRWLWPWHSKNLFDRWKLGGFRKWPRQISIRLRNVRGIDWNSSW